MNVLPGSLCAASLHITFWFIVRGVQSWTTCFTVNGMGFYYIAYNNYTFIGNESCTYINDQDEGVLQ